MSLAEFAKLADGTPVREARLVTAAGAEARVIEMGATLRDLVVPLRDGSRQRVVLGFPTIDAYPSQSHHAGSIAGRFANRIAKGRFPLDGHVIEVPRNNGENSLHGGTTGFNKHVWPVVAHDAAGATLALVSPDGDQGYPGTLRVWCRYELLEPATLAMDIAATTDKPTVVNLANHSYFNLDGSDDARDHELTLMPISIRRPMRASSPLARSHRSPARPMISAKAGRSAHARQGDNPPEWLRHQFRAPALPRRTVRRSLTSRLPRPCAAAKTGWRSKCGPANPASRRSTATP